MAKQFAFFLSLCEHVHQQNKAVCASILQPVWWSSLLKWKWQIDWKNLTVGLSLTLLIQNRKYMTNRDFCYLQQLPYHFGIILWTKLKASAISKMGASMTSLEWSCHKASPWEYFSSWISQSFQAFNHHPLELLWPSITIDAVKSNASSGLSSTNQHIYPKFDLAIGLHWLAGRNLIDICDVYGVSYASVYVITQTFHDAVNSFCPVLSFKFPATNKEKQSVMNGFPEKTSSNYFADVLVV